MGGDNMGVSFDKFENKYIIKGTLTTTTSLHIGSRTSFEINSTDSPVLKDKNGIPYIPGSSFKGIFRSTTDSLLRQFQEKKGLGKKLCCDGAIYLDDKNSEYCVSQEKKNSMKPEEWEKYVVNDMEKELCLSCKLFGSPVIASRVVFKDMRPINFSRNNLSIRDGVMIKRDTGTAADNKKYDFEILSPGVKFNFEMSTENVEDVELGILLNTLEMFNKGYISIGGKKTAGTGKVEINYEIFKIDIDSIFNETPDKVDKSQYIKGLSENLKKWRI